MRKLITVFTALLLLAVTKTNAQGTAPVSGTVKDGNNKPLQSVTVSLLQAKDSGLVKTDISDAKGNFEISTGKEGSFLLSYSSVGFEKLYSAKFEKIANKKIEASPVIMLPATGKLKEVNCLYHY